MFNDYLVEATPASYRAGSLQAAYSTPSAERLLFHPFTINSRSGGRKVGSTEMSEAFRSLNGAVDQEDFMYAAQSFSHPGRSGEVANPFKRTNCINCFCMSLRHQDMDVLESTYQYLKKQRVNLRLSQKHMVGCATEAIVLSMGKVPWANLDGTRAANVLYLRIGPNAKESRWISLWAGCCF